MLEHKRLARDWVGKRDSLKELEHRLQFKIAGKAVKLHYESIRDDLDNSTYI